MKVEINLIVLYCIVALYTSSRKKREDEMVTARQVEVNAQVES